MTRRSVEQIEQLVEQYRERGVTTRRGFCERHHISLSMLDYYLRRYGQEAKVANRLVEVAVTPAETAQPFALVLANGRRIECGGAELAQLIRIAEKV